MRDAQLAAIVRGCLDLPGQDLFGYRDDAGQVHDVTSQDVNEYLRAASGQDYTAKDFRTWGATTLAIDLLRNAPPTKGPGAARRQINEALDVVAEHLGNTRAVCRKSYVHPGVLAAYQLGTLGSIRRAHAMSGLTAHEARALVVLKRLAKHTPAVPRKTTLPNLKTALARSLKQAARTAKSRRAS